MPEAAMDEDYLPAGDENKVRLPWKQGGVERVSVAHGVDQLSYAHFR
jgi:hypothetical protein